MLAPIARGSDIATPRTTSRWLWLYVQASMFCGMWNNRGMIGAISWTAARMATRSANVLWKAASFAHWWMSKPASKSLQAERNSECDECEVLDDTRKGHRYCGACGCPRSKWSELTMKNSRQGHNCPLGTHRGSARIGVGGCKNCGKKKAADAIDPQI